MEGSPFLPLPQGMFIDHVEQTDSQLTVIVVSIRTEAACPGCGHTSEHIHSQYQRTVRDVPCGSRQVVLRLCVRKFFCLSLCCPRKVSAERLADLVQPWARCSDRLLEALKAIGLSASAEVSERLAPRLAMPVKASTLLSYLRTIPDPPRTKVISLGIDDFALKRGDKYGTILINAETSKPLDLIADRTTEAVSPWLASHPEIQVVSRDRANGFAEAVSQVLPHATQVADRYHLIQNLRDHLQQFLDRKRTCLPFIEDTPVGQEETSPSPPQTEVSADLSNLIAPERLKVIRRSKRLARYEQVMALYQKGISQREIARHLRMSRNTVQHYISSPGFPERAEGTGQRNPGTSKLDPYLPYLRDLWDAGNYNSAHLFRLIKARGYTGCESMLRERLSEWRAELPQQRRPGNPRKPRLFKQKKQRRLSSRAASFLMILLSEKLTVKQKVRFANGISRDYAAVYAAFSRPESNGITEGHVNRLKFLKRQMFGRANLDLLRIKVLHAM